MISMNFDFIFIIHPISILVNVINKLIRVIFKLLKTNFKFNAQKLNTYYLNLPNLLRLVCHAYFYLIVICYFTVDFT